LHRAADTATFAPRAARDPTLCPYTTLFRSINTTLDNLTATSAELKNLLVDNRSNLDNTFANLKAGSETLAQALEGLESTLKKTDTFVDSLNALQIGAAVNDLRAMLPTANTNLDAVSNQEGT